MKSSLRNPTLSNGISTIEANSGANLDFIFGPIVPRAPPPGVRMSADTGS